MTHLTRHLASVATLASMLAVAGAAHAQTPTASNVDTNSLRLVGARSQGALLTPSAALMPTHTWELSLSYQFEHAALRAVVPTGEIRGRHQTESIRWLNNRHTGYLQLAASPVERVELVVGVPVLISQTAERGIQTSPAPAGASALGDVRLVARFAMLGERSGPVSWSINAGVVTPSGDESLLFGEKKVRMELGTALGVMLPKSFRLDAYAGHTGGAMSAIGDQIFGDVITAQLALSQQRRALRWFAELSNLNVIADRAPNTAPKRSSLELAGGVRYAFDSFYLDGGVGAGVLDAGITPRVRAMFSVGTTGGFGAKRARNADALDALAGLIRQAEDGASCLSVCGSSAPAGASTVERAQMSDRTSCVLPSEGYTGPVTDEGCIDFQAAASSDAARRHSLEELSVYFDVGQDTLTPTAENTLRGVALLLMRSEGHVVITGHADDRGTDALNDELSLNRADRARRALIEAGIDDARLSIQARGPREPISPHTEFGRSMNRRVTFSWE